MIVAYIDPGSGSILLQALFASLVGGVAIFWYKIKTFFGRNKKDDSATTETGNKQENEKKPE